MPLELLSICFNHDTDSATNDALNIRKNGTETWPRPEWQHDRTPAQQGPAAYAARAPADRNGPFGIKAKFRRTGTDIPDTVWIRAFDPRPLGGIPMGCLGSLVGFLRYYANVLGDVTATEVNFRGSDSEEVLFELPEATVDRGMVRVDDISWRWQYFRRELRVLGRWITFKTTNHRIYCILGVPNDPWVQWSDYRTNPWTDVLDYASAWAVMADNLNRALALVTSRVFSLGPRFIEYDCPNRGFPHYSYDYGVRLYFRCGGFLDRLAGNDGCGPFVNCTDCAAIVVTFSNILGANLRMRRMRDSNEEWWSADPPNRILAFDVNPVRLIGTGVWGICPAHGNFGTFRYHDVSWVGEEETAEGWVYDACLQLDRDDDPGAEPHVPEIATRLPFERYRARFIPRIPTRPGQCALEYVYTVALAPE